MGSLKIAKNIVRLRHEKKVTQESLAEFVGVTKASVSKWETGSSMPDITMLPRLASFFDVTVDELIGYVPQLSEGQIHELYQGFAKDFANGSFEEAMSGTQEYVRKYYSCYPFLFQVCVLWLNHFTLAEGEQRQSEILLSISGLCEHIKQNCRDKKITDDVIVLQAMVHLRLGRAGEVVDALEGLAGPNRIAQQSGIVLMQAYMMAGKEERAESFMQISIYNALLSLVGTASNYIAMHMGCLGDCEPTIERVGRVGETYHLDKLNPNLMAGFEYQASMCYAQHGDKQKALTHIGRYVACLEELFSSDILLLRGDEYFNKIEEWFEQKEGSPGAPRDRQLVLAEVKQSLGQPVFAGLEKEPAFADIKKRLAGLR